MTIGTRIPDRPGEEPEEATAGQAYAIIEAGAITVLKRTYTAPDPRPGEDELIIGSMVANAAPYIDMTNITNAEENFAMFSNTNSTAGMAQVSYNDTANTGIDFYMLMIMTAPMKWSYQIFADRDGDGLIDGAVGLLNPTDEVHLDFTGDGFADQILTGVL